MNDVTQDCIFNSCLSGNIIRFLEYKRSTGSKYKTEENLLRQFDIFVQTFFPDEGILTKRLVQGWTARKSEESNSTWRARTSLLRQFGMFLNNMGILAYVPTFAGKSKGSMFVPYIFSNMELEMFFRACDQIDVHCISHMDTLFPVIMRLLYGCGLRISEALTLRNCDVDLNTGVVSILDSKFSKDRLVIMSDSLLEVISAYSQNNKYSIESIDHLFVNGRYGVPKASTIYGRYRKVLWSAGISHGGKGKGPRLHDFRHTFAVHSLRSMVKQKIDIYVVLPILSTYMGHASIEATEKYLRLTPDIYPELLELTEKMSSYVFPEVSL